MHGSDGKQLLQTICSWAAAAPGTGFNEWWLLSVGPCAQQHRVSPVANYSDNASSNDRPLNCTEDCIWIGLQCVGQAGPYLAVSAASGKRVQQMRYDKASGLLCCRPPPPAAGGGGGGDAAPADAANNAEEAGCLLMENLMALAGNGVLAAQAACLRRQSAALRVATLQRNMHALACTATPRTRSAAALPTWRTLWQHRATLARCRSLSGCWHRRRWASSQTPVCWLQVAAAASAAGALDAALELNFGDGRGVTALAALAACATGSDACSAIAEAGAVAAFTKVLLAPQLCRCKVSCAYGRLPLAAALTQGACLDLAALAAKHCGSRAALSPGGLHDSGGGGSCSARHGCRASLSLRCAPRCSRSRMQFATLTSRRYWQPPAATATARQQRPPPLAHKRR